MSKYSTFLKRFSQRVPRIADNKQTGSLDYKVTYLVGYVIAYKHSKIEHRGG